MDTASQHLQRVLQERHGLTSFKEIGRGGMGVVYKAWDAALQRHVAVKALSTELLDEAGLRRFTTEMQTLGKIRHSAIVSIHYSGVLDDEGEGPAGAYFVMDYVPGGTLAERIRDRREWGNHFSVAETVEILRPIAAALDYLHGKLNPPVIHRDIKPGNVLVPSTEPGEATFEARSLLTDFGISLTPDDTRVTSLSMMIGTERYFAPELYPGESAGAEGVIHNQPNAASDNYALSLIAFEMLTLYPLKDTMSATDWRHERVFPRFAELGISAQDSGNLGAVEEVFRKAFADAPAYRYPTATAFIDALAWTGGQHGNRAPRPIGGRYTADQAPPTRDNPASNPNAMTAETSVYSASSVGQSAGYGLQQNYASQSYAQHFSNAAPTPTAAPAQETKKSGLWWKSLVGLAVLLIVGLGVSIGVQRYVMTPDWDGAEATLARVFPGLVSERENTVGWRGLVCRSADPEQGQLARIACSNEDLFVSVSDYGSGLNREENVNADGAEDLSEGTCKVQSFEVQGNQRPTWAMLPTGARSQFAVLVSSENAKNDRLEVPIC